MKKFSQKIVDVESVFADRISIPEYQRRYSWKQELADGLLFDLVEKFKRQNKNGAKSVDFQLEWINKYDYDMFYLGQIVKNDKNIVDGQQRITTIQIIFKAINDELLRQGFNNDEYHWLFDGIGNKKITPAKVDEEFSKIFQNQSETFASYEKRMRDGSKENKDFLKLVKKSNFYKSYNTILKSLRKERFSKNQLNNLMFFILRDVNFLSINIIDISDAVKFFEIMNSKSVPLTAADLIKNGLIEASSNKEAAAKSWNEVAEELVEYTNDLSKLIRYIYIANIGQVSQAKLFKALQEKGQTTVVEDMNRYLPSYKIIIGGALADSIENDAKLNFILKLGARESLSPILLEILNLNDKSRISNLLTELVSFSFKYFYINGFKANAYSQLVTNICSNIRKGITKPLSSLWEAYRTNVKNDVESNSIDDYKLEWFTLGKEDSRKAMKFARTIYPLLFSAIHKNSEFDPQEYNQSNSINISNLDVEHLYPLNPDFEKSDWDKNLHEDMKWNIGNLIPIASSKNRIAKNSSFKDKYDFYNGTTENTKPSIFFNELFVKLDSNNIKNNSMQWNEEAIQNRNKEVFKKVKDLDLLSLKTKY